jgi:hypothetical protein
VSFHAVEVVGKAGRRTSGTTGENSRSEELTHAAFHVLQTLNI